MCCFIFQCLSDCNLSSPFVSNLCGILLTHALMKSIQDSRQTLHLHLSGSRNRSVRPESNAGAENFSRHPADYAKSSHGHCHQGKGRILPFYIIRHLQKPDHIIRIPGHHRQLRHICSALLHLIQQHM